MESPGDKFVPLATMILTLCFMAQLLYICYNSMVRSVRSSELDEHNVEQFGWSFPSYQHTEELNYDFNTNSGFHPGKYHTIGPRNERPKIYGPENIYDTLHQETV
jgi:hypothetical protein